VRRLLTLAPFLTLLVPAAASAQIMAIPCKDDPYRCSIAGIDFSKKVEAPFTFDFDSGWVPLNSPVQVHLYGGLYAETEVKLSGFFQSKYPDALLLSTPGKPEGGELSFHYGLVVGAKGKVELDVGFDTFTWEGDLPYIPQIDFQVQGAEDFDSWAFDPPATLTSSTQPVTLAQIGIGDIIGVSIPGIDGGFQLDVAVDLTATYRTDRIVVERGDPLMSVAGGAIVTQDGVTNDPYTGETHEIFRVHPEGTVSYDGTIHLIPTFYVELLGQTWEIPIIDFPIDFPITDSEWIFDPQDVQIPFPDLRDPPLVWDMGKVPVGLINKDKVPLTNKGEALLWVSGALAAEDKDGPFAVQDEPALVNDGESGGIDVFFAPQKPGPFEATVELETNDPDMPTLTITLKGIGDGEIGIFTPWEDDGGIAEPTGCGCRTSEGNGYAFGLVLLPLAAVLRRRRRR